MTEASDNELKDFRAEKPNGLLRTQEAAVKLTLKQILEIANRIPKAGSTEKHEPDDLLSVDSGFDRPHQVFSIDGARGAGKTYVLLTLVHAVRTISNHWPDGFAGDDTSYKAWWDFVDGAKSDRHQSGERFKQLAHVIQIIFPSDMEREETVMERIFVSMKRMLDDELGQRKGSSRDDDVRRKLDDLRTELVRKIVPGWHFSKVEGREVILRDAVDYADYSDLFEVEAEKSVLRIEIWRRFLSNFLDHFSTAVLVVFLDDSDVHPDVTEDILRTVRMFLNHPRVVTVLAGNLRSMRSLLLHKAMRVLAQSMNALGNKGAPTANDWRRVERRGVEDYLEKVLPQSQRIFVQQPVQSLQGGDEEEPRDDFKKIANISLNDLCQQILEKTRQDFLHHKFMLAINLAQTQSDRPGAESRRDLGEFLSWWVFRNQYQDALAPRSARQIRTMSDYYVRKERDTSIWKGVPGGRRLIMALFENPANFSLIQQFNDHDINVTTWLQDQYIDSEWVGPRRFHVNGRMLDRGQFGYDYIRFRLDVGLAMPLRQNAEEAIPLNLLPVPHGRTHLRRFFHPQQMARRHRRLGVCQWIDHAVIPANCIYLHDLDALPDRSLLSGKVDKLRQSRSTDVLDREGGISRRGLGQGYWETWLAHNWVDLIADFQDEYTYRYFADVVCVSQTYMNTVPTSDMLRLLDPPSLIQEQEEGIYEFFWREEFSRFAYSTSPQLTDREQLRFTPRHWNQILRGDGSRKHDLAARMVFVLSPFKKNREAILTQSDTLAWRNPGDDAELQARFANSEKQLKEVFPRYERIRMRSLALYAAIINDVRRAWHAIRIFDLSMGALGRMGSLAAATQGRDDERVSFAVLASQDRLTMQTAESIRKQFNASPWTEKLLEAFAGGKIREAVQTCVLECLETITAGTRVAPEPMPSLTVEAIKGEYKRIARSTNITTKQGDIVKTLGELTEFLLLTDETYDRGHSEKDDYGRWVRTLRAVGRVMAPDWPDCGEHSDDTWDKAGDETSYDGTINLGDVDELKKVKWTLEVLIPKSERLRVRKMKGDHDPSEDDVRRVSRSARNFVLLLYGLAPSLPALVHCHLMGILREAELTYQAAERTRAEADGDADAERQADAAKADAGRLYDDVKTQLSTWVDLVVSLAVALRYIRVRYLHLHIALWLQQMNDMRTEKDRIHTKDESKRTDEEKRKLKSLEDILARNSKFILTLRLEADATKPKIDVDKHIPEAEAMFEKLNQLFLPDKSTPASDLAIMPDFASSTMFGDRWLRDTIVSLARSGELDFPPFPNLARAPGDAGDETEQSSGPASNETNPLKADGICQETEQWLWATMRCLKKFHQEATHVIDHRTSPPTPRRRRRVRRPANSQPSSAAANGEPVKQPGESSSDDAVVPPGSPT